MLLILRVWSKPWCYPLEDCLELGCLNRVSFLITCCTFAQSVKWTNNKLSSESEIKRSTESQNLKKYMYLISMFRCWKIGFIKSFSSFDILYSTSNVGTKLHRHDRMSLFLAILYSTNLLFRNADHRKRDNTQW